MKKDHLMHVVITTFIIIITIASSCKKETINKDGLFVYAPAGTAAYNIWKGNYLVTRNTFLLQKPASFPALLTRPYAKDIMVTAKIDTSLIALFDSLYKVISPRFAAGTFNIAGNGTVKIKAGQTASADSIMIQAADFAKIDVNKTYVVPVVLSSPGNVVPISNNRQTMYANISFTKVVSSISSFSGKNTVNMTVNRTPAGDIVTPDIAAFQATVNNALPAALSINIEQDNTLIEAYNKANNTTCIPFPSGSFTLLQDKVTIGANNTSSKDSFKLQVNPQLFEPGKIYLMPYKIKDEGLVVPDEKNKVVYLALTVIVQNIDQTNPTITGTVVSRNNWTGTASSTNKSFADASPAYVFDNNYASGWQANLNTSPVDFKVDMGASRSIKGFSFTPMYWNYFGSNYISDIMIMAVYSSSDGINWVTQGTYNGTALTGNAGTPDIRYVKFYTPVQGRYFKFTISKYSSYMAGMGELNAFE